MINKIKHYIKKYEDVLLYLFFGVLTTLINMVIYFLLYKRLGVANIISNTVAWMVAVIFAFVTNKIWVFKSKNFETDLLFKELFGFVTARVATGVIDNAIMFIGVDILKGNFAVSKIIANVFVVIINYIFSKLLIFRKKAEADVKKL